jgi:hypothetical protein
MGKPERARQMLAARAREVIDTTLVRSTETYHHLAIGAIALAEGRPRDAVREFWKGDSLPDGPVDGCDVCTLALVASAYDRGGIPDSAIAVFERYFASSFSNRAIIDFAYRAPFARRLGELYEGKGDEKRAAHYYAMFIELWQHADALLQPQVADARRRLARLAADGK